MHMIIYEVNLTINNDIYAEYYHWLIDHVKEMLKFPGFKTVEIAKEKLLQDNNNQSKLTVRYTLNSEDDLDNYLNHHAPRIREEGIKKFGNQFSATRRIFENVHTHLIVVE